MFKEQIKRIDNTPRTKPQKGPNTCEMTDNQKAAGSFTE
jgi:hypothetical protein